MEQTGLSTAEADKELRKSGYNELPATASKSVWHIAVEVFKEPMFLLLLTCSILYILLGDLNEGIILMSSIIVIIYITFYQYRKTERALEALRKLSVPLATVLRDGVAKRISGREVVPGDILVLSEGDRISADARIIHSHGLSVDESLLTGESVPVIKLAQTGDTKDNDCVFSGTLVVQGSARAEVTATGAHTRFGKIGFSLHKIVQEDTDLQKEMKALIKRLFIVGVLISIAVVCSFYFTRGDFIQSLLTGLAASMAILPEEFPVVLTVFLALGSWRLSKNNVLVRKPAAVETLGAVTVLCSDKTGTITQNLMEVAAVYTEGSIIYRDDFLNQAARLSGIVETAGHACPQFSADPMELAIQKQNRVFNTSGANGYDLVKVFPLTKWLFAMTILKKDKGSGQFFAFTKGAPEAVIRLCRLDSSRSGEIEETVKILAGQGLRVLAVASSGAPVVSVPEKQEEFSLNFCGLLAFEDPVRKEVPQAIADCRQAGIKVIMITGDYPVTAKCIAEKAGLSANSAILTGNEIDAMDEVQLQKSIKDVGIFARVVPEQKLRIVRALQHNGEVVAMTGDGVNDAPALKAADIGVAMGAKGTDVAREASSLVLLDDHFTSIVSAVRSGRRIYDNLQKSMSYILAVHMPIIFLTLLPAFFNQLPVLLMPLHIVFMELIIDPVCSLAFESQGEEKDLMKRRPRRPGKKFFGINRILMGMMKGSLLFAAVLIVYFFMHAGGHKAEEVRAVSFTTLIIGNIFLIISELSQTRSAFAVLRMKNLPLKIILLLALCLLFLINTVPVLRDIFKFTFPGGIYYLLPVLSVSAMFILLELFKFTLNKKVRGRTS